MRPLVIAALLMASSPAWALKICAADFQKAVEDTTQGKAASTKIESMYGARKAELEKMQAALDKAIQDYQSRQLILSADAKAAEQQKLAQQDQAFQQKYMQYQNEMQQEYVTALQSLGEKMRTVAQTVGKEQACTVLLDKAVVIYAGADMTDLTSTLVTRYNAQYK